MPVYGCIIYNKKQKRNISTEKAILTRSTSQFEHISDIWKLKTSQYKVIWRTEKSERVSISIKKLYWLKVQINLKQIKIQLYY